ncbi:MAG TPA: CHASE2 domain-containing protein, partial [Rhodocyclaceae bacterium]|nr:CHASE2 domain-containing protein [Rhodocyclaceae bacterium]
MLRQNLIRYALGALVLLILLGHSAKVYEIGFASRLDAILYDQKVRLTMPRNVDDRVVIVDIDEKSLAEVGRWPWGRDKLAAMVTKLVDKYGIAVVGFDVVFAEPDNSSGLGILDAMARRELKDSAPFQAALRDLRPQLDYDALFAEAVKGRPVILGYYFSSREDGTSSGLLPAPVLPAGSFQGRKIDFTHWLSYAANLPELQQNAAGAGHFNPWVDQADGISRRVPLIAEYQGKYYEALSLAMVRAVLGFPKVVPGFPEERFFSSKTYSD